MAQLPCIGLSWPLTKPPFGSCAIYFHILSLWCKCSLEILLNDISTNLKYFARAGPLRPPTKQDPQASKSLLTEARCATEPRLLMLKLEKQELHDYLKNCCAFGIGSNKGSLVGKPQLKRCIYIYIIIAQSSFEAKPSCASFQSTFRQ